jgi:hypothetical protein
MAATINSPRYHPLLLEKRLVNSCGQVIRYTLRTIFNPIPERARFGGAQKQRISDLIALRSNPTGGIHSKSEAVEDGALSSLMNRALSQMYDFFGHAKWSHCSSNNNMLALPMDMENYDFCSTTPACLKQDANTTTTETTNSSSSSSRNARNAPLLVILQQEWEAMQDDIAFCGLYLATYHACRFLQELFSIAKVQEHLNEHFQDEWRIVQEHAEILGRYCFNDGANEEHDDGNDNVSSAGDRVVEQEVSITAAAAYLVALRVPRVDIAASLGPIVQLLETRADDCQTSLNALRSIFKSKSNTCNKFKRAHAAELESLEIAFADADELYMAFPSVLERS